MVEHNDLHKLYSDVTACIGEFSPRYTSYPPATRLGFENEASVYEDRLRVFAKEEGRTISLYGHIPFCQTLCFFCACNREITKDKNRADKYIHALKKEITLLGEKFLPDSNISTLHLGGGTPNFLSLSQIEDLIRCYKDHFKWNHETEFSIELDPRTTSISQLKLLSELGCGRISVGVQDFDPKVQRRINRVQSFEDTQDLFSKAREFGIKHTGVDIIYGLPLQTRTTFNDTLSKVVTLNPDRIAVYGYAHVTSMAPGQQSFSPEELPSQSLRLDLFCDAISLLTSHGYFYIGIDHFVKSTDPLYKAFKNNELGRSFMGYTSERGVPVVATGASAISLLPDFMVQNIRSIKGYQEFFESPELDTLPFEKGLIKTTLDLAAAEAIEAILTCGSLNCASLRRKFGPVSEIIFEHSYEMLSQFEKLGMLTKESDVITLSKHGQIFGRSIATAFDPYLKSNALGQRLSPKPASLII
jgi:oxygen-independent coproporphyrinogen-3 oxidase